MAAAGLCDHESLCGTDYSSVWAQDHASGRQSSELHDRVHSPGPLSHHVRSRVQSARIAQRVIVPCAGDHPESTSLRDGCDFGVSYKRLSRLSMVIWTFQIVGVVSRAALWTIESPKHVRATHSAVLLDSIGAGYAQNQQQEEGGAADLGCGRAHQPV